MRWQSADMRPLWRLQKMWSFTDRYKTDSISVVTISKVAKMRNYWKVWWNLYSEKLKEAVQMKSRQTIFCDTCNHYLRNITKKMFYYHQQYHIKNCFTCDTCKLIFDSESLLNFHILKNHEHGSNEWMKNKYDKGGGISSPSSKVMT